MKTKSILIIGIALLALSSCSDKFLERYPDGSTLTANQYAELDDILESSVRGIWSQFYLVSDHDLYGVRSIDLFTDMYSGDIAMKRCGYGWYQIDEEGETRSYRSSYLWSFYYNIIRLCNLGLNAVDAKGRPAHKAFPKAADLTEADELEIELTYYTAQLLAVRGYCYANMLKLFEEPDEAGTARDEKLVVPFYDESYTTTDALFGAPRATVGELNIKIADDLREAISYLDSIDSYVVRESKMEINSDVAKLILAYSQLNSADYDEAFKYAKQVIDETSANILPHSQLFSTGFADLKNNNWLWGKPVSIDNTGGLASFFGQFDIHTYSYAYAGDVKTIDDALYKEIQAQTWDDRVNWFRKDAQYDLVGDRKFYSPGYENTTDAESIDRDWTNDDVWMRLELAYLVAAEAAAYRTNPSIDTAVLYLDAIMSERVIEGEEAAYQTYKSSLNAANIKDALVYNWRVEMWGEGYSLQTLRRLQGTRKLGSNHMSRASEELKASSYALTFAIPTSEARYNPYLLDVENLAEADY